MALITQSVKNLIAGVSKQVPQQRYPEQLEEQINAFSSESGALRKRPPSKYIATLNGTQTTLNTFPNEEEVNRGYIRPYIHLIDRSKDEKYIVCIGADNNNIIQVYNLDGEKMTVEVPAKIINYLNQGTNTLPPYQRYKVVSVGDHTFICNVTCKTRLDNDLSNKPELKALRDSYNNQGVLIHVKQGQYGRNYQIVADGNIISNFETPNGSHADHVKQIDTDYIAYQLEIALRGRSNFYNNMFKQGLQKGSSYVYIRGDQNNLKLLTTQDGFNNQAMTKIWKSIQRFSMLPAVAPNNFTVEVRQDPTGGKAGNYYVKYNQAKGVWQETVKPDETAELDQTTMPIKLVRVARNHFRASFIDWEGRKVGDENSNPSPSFIGKPIKDIFFYRNRLGFLSDENVILSASGDYYNFFMSTATDILDTDPIDVATTTTRVNILNYAVPFSGELYCFSDKSQFVLRSETTLSPKNTALVELTAFPSSPICRPTRSGRNLYFTADNQNYSSVFEYYSVAQTSEEKNAQDISSHIPHYIPENIGQIIPCEAENTLFFLPYSIKDCDKLFVYKYLFLDEKRVQSSWSKWQFTGRILGGVIVGSSLYILVRRGTTPPANNPRAFSWQTTLEVINLSDKHSDDTVYLDCQFKMTTTTVVNYNNRPKYLDFNLPSNIPLRNFIGQPLDLYTVTGKHIVKHKSNKETIYLPTTQRDLETNTPIVEMYAEEMLNAPTTGIPYEFNVTLSPIFMRQMTSDNRPKTLENGRYQLRYLHLGYENTNTFDVYVDNTTDSQEKIYSYNNTPLKLGLPQAQIGTPINTTGTFRVPLQMENTKCKIQIKDKSPFPLALTSYSVDGSFIQRTRGG